jgi:hypothetical protein
LYRLEELCRKDSFDRWESTEEDEGKTNSSLAELMYLSHLMVLVIRILEAKLLSKELHFKNLKRFDISTGFKSCGEDLQFPNSLTLEAHAKYIMDNRSICC